MVIGECKLTAPHSTPLTMSRSLIRQNLDELAVLQILASSATIVLRFSVTKVVDCVAPASGLETGFEN